VKRLDKHHRDDTLDEHLSGLDEPERTEAASAVQCTFEDRVDGEYRK
jgi:hypothetical protein